MHALPAYVVVVAIWATTPIAIKISNQSLSPIAAVLLRMLLAAFLVVGILCLLRLAGRKRIKAAENWRIYLAASITIFPNMPLVYFASQYISSGLVSVLFGLTPFFTGIASFVLLGDPLLSVARCLALCMAMIGLLVISMDQLGQNHFAMPGIFMMIASNMLFAVSNVLIKKATRDSVISPFEQTTGALLFALPGLLMTWYWVDGATDVHISEQSLIAVVYLAVFGSVIGFMAFFYVLANMRLEQVALIPLITPVLALWLGVVMLEEQVSLRIMLGTGLILSALTLYNDQLLKYAVNGVKMAGRRAWLGGAEVGRRELGSGK